MLRRPPVAHRTATPFPSATRVRSNRASSPAGGSPLAVDPASVAFILFLQPPGRERGVGIAEFRQRDAGAVGVFERDHRFGQEQQAVRRARALLVGLIRSEEHTSELQSLMRTSYAVLC